MLRSLIIFRNQRHYIWCEDLYATHVDVYHQHKRHLAQFCLFEGMFERRRNSMLVAETVQIS